MKNPTFFRASSAKSAAEKLARKRELPVPEKGRCLRFLFPLADRSLEDCSSAPVAQRVLNKD